MGLFGFQSRGNVVQPVPRPNKTGNKYQDQPMAPFGGGGGTFQSPFPTPASAFGMRGTYAGGPPPSPFEFSGLNAEHRSQQAAPSQANNSGLPQPGSPQFETEQQVNLVRQRLNDTSRFAGLIQAAEEAGNLSPEAQEALARGKEYAAQTIDQLNSQILAQLGAMQIQDVLLQSRLNPDTPVVIGELMSLADAENLQPGLSEEWLESVTANAGNPKAIEALLHSQQDRAVALTEIENFVFQKNQIKDQIKLYEDDLRAHEIAMQTPTIPLNMMTDPNDIVQSQFFSQFDQLSEGMDPVQEEALANQLYELQSFAENADAVEGGDQQVKDTLTTIANQFGIDPAELQGAFQRGMISKQTAADELQRSGESTSLKPFSIPAAFRIFNAAVTRVDPDTANALANSPLMHRILEMSGGNVNFKGGGDLKGIGSLSDRVYNELGVPFESIKTNTDAQLGALVDYILAGWDGDIAAAYQEMVTKNEWGTLQMLQRDIGEIPEFSQYLGGE